MEELIEEVKEINEENDIFGTYQKAKSICEFIELERNQELLSNNNLIAIYGAWGTGKSCLMKTIYNKLNKDKFDTLWFDTWKYEKDENLAYSLFKYIGKEDEYYFKGHFPGNPIMPGVLIVESLAQTGAVAILSMEENKGKNALFGGIDKLRFKKQVVPGDTLRLEVKIIKKKGPIGIGEAVATVDGKIAAKGELTFAIV